MTGGLRYVTVAGVDASVNVQIKCHATQPGGLTPGIAGGETLGGRRVHLLSNALTEDRAISSFLTLCSL